MTYITKLNNKCILNMDKEAAARLQKHSLKGCTFKNYNCFDFLLDEINMYNWIFKPGNVEIFQAIQEIKKHDYKMLVYGDDIYNLICFSD